MQQLVDRRPEATAGKGHRSEIGIAGAGSLSATPSLSISWLPPTEGFLKPALRDAALTLASLGIYRFWAKTHFRQRLWSSVRIDGTPLVYTGKPADLYRPAMAVFIAGVASAIAFAIWTMFRLPLPSAATFRSPWRLTLTLPLLILAGLSQYRSRHFILAHTSWRGTTGRMTGRPEFFGLRYFLFTLAMTGSLFLALPWRTVAVHRRLLADTEFAGHNARLDGNARPLYRRFWVPWLGLWVIYLATVVGVGMLYGPKILAAARTLTIPAFTTHEWLVFSGMIAVGLLAFATLAAWYQGHAARHLWASTRWNGWRFRLEISAWSYAGLALSGWAIRILSLGLLADIAEMRRVRAIVRALHVERCSDLD